MVVWMGSTVPRENLLEFAQTPAGMVSKIAVRDIQVGNVGPRGSLLKVGR